MSYAPTASSFFLYGHPHRTWVLALATKTRIAFCGSKVHDGRVCHSAENCTALWHAKMLMLFKLVDVCGNTSQRLGLATIDILLSPPYNQFCNFYILCIAIVLYKSNAICFSSRHPFAWSLHLGQWASSRGVPLYVIGTCKTDF